MESQSRYHTGDNYFTASVEYEKLDAGSTKHPHATKEVQILEITNEQTFE